MRKTFFALLAAAFLAIPVFAQQKILTLEEAVSLALANDYGILLAKNEAEANSLDVDYINWAFAPRLNAALGTVWNNNNQRQEFSDGTVRQSDHVRSNNLTGSVGLNWTLFDGMKMFVTRDKTLAIARTGELVVKEQVVNTVAQVRDIYYNIVRQKQQLKAVEEQMSVSEERVKVADRKLSTGLGSKPELLQAKVDLNAQKASQLQQLTLIAQLKEQLNQRCGMRLPAEFDVVEEIPIDRNLNLSAIEQNIANTNPSLLLAERYIGIAQLTLKENEASRWPKLDFNAAYNLSRNNNQSVVNPFQPLISGSNGFNYGFTATIPIVNNRLVHRNIEQSRIAIRGYELTLENQRLGITTDLRNAFRDYEYEQQALQLEEENISLAKENVAIALERFRQGVSTYLELREAQKSLEDAYNRLIAARYNAKVAETEVLRLKGDLVR
jgi:outer membrane protein TolC